MIYYILNIWTFNYLGLGKKGAADYHTLKNDLIKQYLTFSFYQDRKVYD